MGFESYGGSYEVEQPNELNNEQIISSFNDAENNIQKLYEINKDKDGADRLVLKQYNEFKKLKEQKEKPIINEVREKLDRQALINEAKTMLYEGLGISENISENNWGENFGKGLVDTLILDNYELAIQVWETNGKIILDSIKKLFSSWENIKKVAEALGESVMGLFSGDPYELGKSVADLGLIGSGVGVSLQVGKKAFKIGMKQISKLRKKAENVVKSTETRQIIGETIDQVEEIIPKKKVNIEELAKKSVNIEKQITKLEKIGIPESFSRDMLESGLMREKFFGGDLFKRFEALNNKGIDINGKIDEVIKDIPSLTREEALLIFSYTDKTIFEKLNGFMRGDKNIIESMTKENIDASIKLASSLEKALEKMPNLKGDLILRGDDWKGWLTEGNNIPLKAFTSVSNNKSDIFLGELHGNNILVEIIGKQGRVKDASSLALFVQFGKKLGKESTLNEGIILPNSIVKFISKENKIHNLDNVDQLITEVIVKQIK